MRRALLALLVVGCGTKPPPPQPVRYWENALLVSRGPDPNRSSRTEQRRPNIDVRSLLPDFSAELRWPLTGMSHPILEPRFAIAQELAVPGVEWQQLCARGVQNRTSSIPPKKHIAAASAAANG